MKRLIFTLVMAALAGSYLLLGCEKDDICTEDTLTTPNLVVEFFKADNQDEANPVGETFSYFIPGKPDSIKPGNVSRIELPLRADTTYVKWALSLPVRKPDGTYKYNTDYLEFKYTGTNTYVSRACGFKTTFTLAPRTPSENYPLVTDVVPADNLWIKSREVVNYNIETDTLNEVHLKIYW